MKFVHAYVLCALFITAQMKGAEEQQFDEKQSPIKGLTELIASIPEKTHWTKTGRQVDPLHTFIIFGSAQSNNKKDSNRFVSEDTPILKRSFNIYPFRQTFYNKNEKKAAIKTHEKSLRVYLDNLGSTEETNNFSTKPDRTFFEPPRITSHKSEPRDTDSFTFNPNTKQGYTTQVLAQLQHEINPESIKARTNELTWETQKSIAALAVRYKHLSPHIKEAKDLQESLTTYRPAMNDDFVFIINALIDDIKAHNQNVITDQQAINLLFTQDTQFKIAQEKFNTINKDTDEFMPEIKQFGNCYGTLPSTLAQCARKVYNSWWTSQGEPALARELRAANEKLMQAEDTQQKEELQKYICNLRAGLYGIMIKNIRTFACQDETAYVYQQNEEDLNAINHDIAEAQAEEQKIAQQLQHILPKNVPAAQAIETIIGWPKGKQQDATVMAERLAKALV